MEYLPSDPVQPASSGEFEFSDPERFDDVDRKHRRLAELLRERKYDGWLIQDPANFCWLTSGAPCPRPKGGSPTAALFFTTESRVVATNNIEASQLFDRHLGGLGFQLKQRPWYETRGVLLDDLCRGRKVASDAPFPATTDESALLTGPRCILAAVERERLRKLAATVAHAVEATARGIDPGQTEAEVAAQVAHRLLRHEVFPVEVRACADGRTAAYRHWLAGPAEITRCVMISATGSQFGLHCTATRTVMFGTQGTGFIEAFQKATMLCGTGMHFTQAGQNFRDVWPKVKRIYEKQGLLDEWQHADQAEVMGYRPREICLSPTATNAIEAHMAVCWHPSVAGAMVGDTMLVNDNGFELLTAPNDWPLISITVKGRPIELPDLLMRPQSS